MRRLTISTGRSRNDARWVPKEVEWSDITTQLSHVRHTAETVAEYKAMSQDDRGKVKDVGGFVGGHVNGARKTSNVTFRSVLALDIDYARETTLSDIKDVVDGKAWCIYSTHSHTPTKPRLRLVMPLDRNVTPDEYAPIARRIADYVGIESVDPASFRINQLMYWPSCPSDGEFIYEVGDGDPIDADAMLRTYRDWRDFSEWPCSSAEKTQRRSEEKLGDPTAKPGYIGAFCKLYPVSKAIETFLPDIYEPTLTEGRYTYKEGTTAGGLIVYDDLFAYSHHATDPIGGAEVNAFDLVRIHKFGARDAGKQTGKITDLPSYRAMEEFCEALPEVKVLCINRSVKGTPEEVFASEIEATGELWKSELRTEKKGGIICDPFNCDIICKNDPGLKGTVKYDEFANEARVTRDLPWRKVRPGSVWDDTDDKGLLWYMSAHYKLTGKQIILDAHDLVIRQSAFHPVRGYLNSLAWDGTERLDTMLIDYMGALDTPLNRAVTRKHMVAAVARVMCPGTKYDYVLTLSGPEGAGKTSLISKLGMQWYSSSFSSSDVGDKTSMEQVQGQWLIELGELVSVKKNTVEAFKSFITTDTDKFRPAYGRKTEVFPRQCVFWATTNERFYLKGDTGNRRFWTVYVHADMPAKDVWDDLTQDVVDQLWAEAVVRWKAGENLYLDHDLEKEARKISEEANEVNDDGLIGVIEAFLRRPVSADWEDKSKEERAEWFKFGKGAGLTTDNPENRRKHICVQAIANEMLGRNDVKGYESRYYAQLIRKIDGLEDMGASRASDKAYGVQKSFRVSDRFWTKNELE